MWENYENSVKDFKKKYPKDRSQYFKYRSLAHHHNSHIQRFKINPQRTYSPKKVFKTSIIQKVGTPTAQFTKTLKVSLNKWRERSETTLNAVSKWYCVNLSKGSNAEYVCKAPLKAGIIPSKARPPIPETIMAHSSKLIPEEYRRDVSQDLHISGGFDTFQGHIRNFSEGKFKEGKVNYDFNHKYMSRYVNRVGKFPMLPDPGRTYAWLGNFRDKSACGGETSYSFKDTRTGFTSFTKLADKLDKIIRRKGPIGVPVYITGGKGRPFINKQPGDVLCTRVVSQEDKVCFSLSKPFVRAIENQLFNNFDTPMMIGKYSSNYSYELIYFRRKVYKRSIEIDYSLFDSTVPKDKIVAAFSLARAYFPRSRRIDNMFLYFCRHFIYKNTVLPDGNVILFKRGVPSGSAWTTIINSIVNCLCCEQIIGSYRAFGSNKDMDYIVNGDDTEIFTMEDSNFDPEKLKQWMKNKNDMDMKIEYVGPCISNDIDNASTFLKASSTWVDDRCVTSATPLVMQKRLTLGTNYRSTPNEVVEAAFEQMNNLIQHPKTIDYCVRMCMAYTMFPGDASKCTEEYRILTEMFISAQNRIFNSTDILGDDKYIGRTGYKGEKVCLANTDSINIVPDEIYMKNWYKDNVDHKFKVNKMDRLTYFDRIMGRNTSMELYFKEKGYFTPFYNWIKYSLPLNEGLGILKSYLEWKQPRHLGDSILFSILDKPLNVIGNLITTFTFACIISQILIRLK